MSRAVIVIDCDTEWLRQVSAAIGLGLREAYDAGAFGEGNQPFGPVLIAAAEPREDILGCFGEPELGAGTHRVLVEEEGERITVTHSMKCRRTHKMQDCPHLTLMRTAVENGHVATSKGTVDGSYTTTLDRGALLWDEITEET